MVTPELVDRINELSRKQRTVGLDDQEREEQAVLRRKYLDSFRANLQSALDNVKVVTPEEYERMVASGEIPSPEGTCSLPEHAHKHDGTCDCDCKH